METYKFNIDDCFEKIDIKDNEELNILFYRINYDLEYPYYIFLLLLQKDICDLLKIKNTSDNEEYIIRYLEYTNINILIKIKGYKRYNNKVFCFIEYDNNINILNYENNIKYTECILHEIVNIKEVYNTYKITEEIYDFFINNIDCFKIIDINTNFSINSPLSIYYGTKRKYLNDLLLLGKEDYMDNTNYYFFDYATALNNSIYNIKKNENYVKIKINISNKEKIKIIKKNKNNIFYYKKGGLYLKKNDKKVLSLKKCKINEDSRLKIVEFNETEKYIYLKLERQDILNSSYCNTFDVYEYYNDTSNRIILKYCFFDNNYKYHIKDEDSKNEDKHILLDGGRIILKTDNYEDLSFITYLNI